MFSGLLRFEECLLHGACKLRLTCFPNGLARCPRKFTKLTKAPLTYLRLKNSIVSGYIDDFFLQGQSYTQCENTVLKAVELFDSLGFVIHPYKSSLIPRQEIVYLGFHINSRIMRISLTLEKKENLQKFIVKILASLQISIRTIACLVGKLVSSLPGSRFGALYYRNIERDKVKALSENRGNFDANLLLSVAAKGDLQWWLGTIPHMYAPIHLPPITNFITCDASSKGWGEVMGTVSTGGAWLPSELTLHINMEMIAILYALRCFDDKLKNLHIRVLSDNTTAVPVVNKMGTMWSPECTTVAQHIW